MSKQARITQQADRVQMTLATDVAVGDMVAIGADRIAVAGTTALAGEENVYYVGDVVVEATAGEAISIGDTVYLTAGGKIVKTATDNTRAGYAVSEAAGDGSPVSFVLNG
jgi:predicted RecA/RadA family phage recombinase